MPYMGFGDKSALREKYRSLAGYQTTETPPVWAEGGAPGLRGTMVAGHRRSRRFFLLAISVFVNYCLFFAAFSIVCSFFWSFCT
jgi:hypothetical protein